MDNITIEWNDLIAIALIAIAQASVSMDVARMKIFRTFRQAVLYRAAKAEHKRRKVSESRIKAWCEQNPGQSFPVYEKDHIYNGMSWTRFFYEAISCPYCLGHYMSLLMVLIYQPRPVMTQWWLLDLVLSCFLITTVSTLFAGLIHQVLDPMPAHANLDDEKMYSGMAFHTPQGREISFSHADSSDEGLYPGRSAHYNRQ